MIKLRDDIIFEDPQLRIREYCAIEIYQGYDDKHNINDEITKDDIYAANKLYAMIDRYDKKESSRLLNLAPSISNVLSSIPDKDIFEVSDKEWIKLKNNIKELLVRFLSIKGIALAKATKILHLKRPHLFPVLDSFILKFLFGINISDIEKRRQIKIGLEALGQIREILTNQKVEFENLAKQISDLPIRLTPVRMFDILCWTAEKWDIQGKRKAPYGTPQKSLLPSVTASKDKLLFHYQKESIEIIKKASESKERILLSIATGFGRSNIVVQALKELLEAKKVKRALIIAPRNEILNNFYDILSKHKLKNITHLFVFKPHFRSYLEQKFKDVAIFLSSLNMLRTEVKKFPSDFFDIFFLDECHTFSKKDWEIIQDFEATLVGLTTIPPSVKRPSPITFLDLTKPTYSYGISTVTLKELANVFLGASYSSADLSDTGTWKFIRPRDVKNNRILKVKTFVSEKVVKKISRSILIAGDIIVQNTFSFSKMAIVKKKDLPAVASKNFFIIRSKRIHSDFLLDYFQSNTMRVAFQKQLEDLAHGIIKHVNLAAVKEISIPIPFSEKDLDRFVIPSKRIDTDELNDLRKLRDEIRQLSRAYQKYKKTGD